MSSDFAYHQDYILTSQKGQHTAMLYSLLRSTCEGGGDQQQFWHPKRTRAAFHIRGDKQAAFSKSLLTVCAGKKGTEEQSRESSRPLRTEMEPEKGR